MGQTFSNLLVHIVFSTKERARLITPEVRPRLYAYMGGMVREVDSALLEIGGVEETMFTCSSSTRRRSPSPSSWGR